MLVAVGVERILIATSFASLSSVTSTGSAYFASQFSKRFFNVKLQYRKFLRYEYHGQQTDEDSVCDYPPPGCLWDRVSERRVSARLGTVIGFAFAAGWYWKLAHRCYGEHRISRNPCPVHLAHLLHSTCSVCIHSAERSGYVSLLAVQTSAARSPLPPASSLTHTAGAQCGAARGIFIVMPWRCLAGL